MTSQLDGTAVAAAGRRPAPWVLSETDWRLIILTGDALALAAAFLAARNINIHAGGRPDGMAGAAVRLAVLWALWLGLAPMAGTFRLHGAAAALDRANQAARSAVATALVYVLTPSVSADVARHRSGSLLFVVAVAALLPAWRYAVFSLRRAHARRQRVLIIGAGWAGRTLQQLFASDLRYEYRLAGYLDDDPEKLGTTIGGVSVLAPTSALRETAIALDISEAILALPHYADTNVAPAVIRAFESGIRVTRMADLYEATTGRVPIQHEGNYWYADLPLERQPSSVAFAVKRCLDVLVALAGLTAMALILPAAVVAIKLSSPGPIFYRQERLGRLGRRFNVVKFRSMVVEAESDGQARLAQPGDPRITRLGRLMRKSRFDELPQLWSVLKGDMSLVGPRPERPEVGAVLEAEWAAFRSRLLVKPGLTGWSQVNMSYASTQEQMLPKLQYDLYYIKHWSLLLDLVILVRTVGVVLRLSGT